MNSVRMNSKINRLLKLQRYISILLTNDLIAITIKISLPKRMRFECYNTLLNVPSSIYCGAIYYDSNPNIMEPDHTFLVKIYRYLNSTDHETK